MRLPAFLVFAISTLLCIGCGVQNKSVLTGTYDAEPFELKGKLGMLSRGPTWVECAQGVSFDPAYPLGDQFSFTMGFKDQDLYPGFTSQIGKNLLLSNDSEIDVFYILGYTNKEVEIKQDKAVAGDYFIVDEVILKVKKLRSSFKELEKAILLKGRMRLHFDNILINSEFELHLAQCYK